MANKRDIASQFVDEFPDGAARVLEGHQAEPVSAFVEEIPDSLSIKVLGHMLPTHAAECIERLSTTAAARYLAELPPRSTAAILRSVTDEARRGGILKALPARSRIWVERAMRYPRSTVGGWMDSAFSVLHGDCKVDEALSQLREQADGGLQPVFVVGQDQQLAGTVRLDALIWPRKNARVADIAIPAHHQLRAGASVVDALEHEGWRDNDTLPVVDQGGRLVGAIRHSELRKATGGQSADDATRATGAVPLDITTIWFSGLATAIDLMATADRRSETFMEADNDGRTDRA